MWTLDKHGMTACIKYLDHTGWFSCQVVAGVAQEGQYEYQCLVTV